MIDRLLAALAEVLVGRRALVLAVVALIVAGSFSAMAVRGFRADFSPQALFTTFEDQQRVDAEFVDRFGKTENIALLVFEAEDVLAPDVLQTIHEFSRAVEDAPWAERVESLTLSSLPRPGEPGELRVDPPIRGDTIEEAERAELLRGLERSGLLEGSLISESRHTATIAIFLGAERTAIETVRPIIDELRTLIDGIGAPPGVTITLTGLPYIRVFVVEKMLGDQIRLIPIAMVVSTLLLLLTFRWFAGVVGANLTVGLGVLVMLAGMSISGEPFNIINQILPILLIIIGMNDAVHIVSRYAEEVTHSGDRLAAAKETFRSMAVACFLTSVTTAVGFGTLVVSRTEILRRFGVTAALAVLAAYVMAMLFLPKAMSYARAPKKTAIASHDGGLDRGIDAVVGRALGRPRLTLLLGAIAITFGAWLVSRVTIDTMLLETFPENTPIHQQIKLLERELDGVLPYEIYLQSDTEGRFDDPAILNDLDALSQWLRERPEVLSVTSYSDVLHEVWVAYADDPEKRTAPLRSVAQVAQLASLLEGAESDPTTEYVTRDRTALRVNLQVADVGSRQALILSEALEAELTRVLAPHDDVRFAFTGDAYSGSRGLESLISDMRSNLVLAMAIIFGIMTLLFRSLRLGILSVPPNLIPLIGTAAWMGARGIYLNTTTVIVFSIAIGLAVDDTIHFLSRFREELPRSRTVEEAIHRAARGSGRAMLMTSVMLLGGLFVMSRSSFVPIQWFSELMAATIGFAIIGDLTILPAMLMLFWPRDQVGRALVKDDAPVE